MSSSSRHTFDGKKARLRAALLDRDDPLCAYCRVPLAFMELPHTLRHIECDGEQFAVADDGYTLGEIDHVVPLAGGGTNDLTNLVLSCGRCNSRKGARLGWRP